MSVFDKYGASKTGRGTTISITNSAQTVNLIVVAAGWGITTLPLLWTIRSGTLEFYLRQFPFRAVTAPTAADIEAGCRILPGVYWPILVESLADAVLGVEAVTGTGDTGYISLVSAVPINDLTFP